MLISRTEVTGNPSFSFSIFTRFSATIRPVRACVRACVCACVCVCVCVCECVCKNVTTSFVCAYNNYKRHCVQHGSHSMTHTHTHPHPHTHTHTHTPTHPHTHTPTRTRTHIPMPQHIQQCCHAASTSTFALGGWPAS